MSYTRDQVLLKVDGVTKRYGTKEVLSGVNVQINDLHCSDAGRVVGQVVAFLGPSGVGKTQLLKIIAGLEKPTMGTVCVESGSHVVAGDIGFVFQKYPMSMNRTVWSNLILSGEMAGMKNGVAVDKAKQYLQQFELDLDAHKYPAELSGGMQQRVAICRQLMNMEDSRIMLMDEPFSALDPRNTRRVCRLIRRVADLSDKTTVVVVTHDIRAALSVADMVWIMGRTTLPDGSHGGGTILKCVDLADMELAWHPERCEDDDFLRLERSMLAEFDSL